MVTRTLCWDESVKKWLFGMIINQQYHLIKIQFSMVEYTWKIPFYMWVCWKLTNRSLTGFGEWKKTDILTKSFWRIKFKEIINLIGFQNMRECEFKINRENVDLNLKLSKIEVISFLKNDYIEYLRVILIYMLPNEIMNYLFCHWLGII